jgi:hypothetical protein
LEREESGSLKNNDVRLEQANDSMRRVSRLLVVMGVFMILWLMLLTINSIMVAYPGADYNVSYEEYRSISTAMFFLFMLNQILFLIVDTVQISFFPMPGGWAFACCRRQFAKHRICQRLPCSKICGCNSDVEPPIHVASSYALLMPRE